MDLNRNWIFLKREDKMEILAAITKKYKKILLIVEDKHEEYFDDFIDNRAANIHDNTIYDRMIIHRSSLFYFVRKGFITIDKFDAFVLIAHKTDASEMLTFKILNFYENEEYAKVFQTKNYNKLAENSQPEKTKRSQGKMFVFCDELAQNDSVYFRAQVFDDQKEDQSSSTNSVQLIYCKPEYSSQHKTYLQLKTILNFPDQQNLEEISYKFVLKKLLAELKRNAEMAKKSEKYKEVQVDDKKLEKISLNNLKLKTLEDLLKKNADKKVYVVCKREFLLNFLKFFNEHTEDVDLIIYFDLIDVEIKAKQAIVLIDENTNKDSVLEILKKHENKSAGSFFNLIKNTQGEYVRTEEGAYVEKSQAHVILNRVLTNIKYIYEQYFLFLSGAAYSDVYIRSSLKYKCYLKLPEISDCPIFSRQYISEEKASKKDALHDVSVKILQKLVETKVLTGNLVPNVQYFILNDFFKTKLQNVYKFNPELMINFDEDLQKNCHRIGTAPLNYYDNLLNNKDGKDKPIYFTKVFNWLFLLLKKFYSRNVSDFKLKYKFKQKYMITFKQEKTLVMQSKAVPRCFSQSDSHHLYSIKSKNHEIGIICGESFRETFEFESTVYSFLGEIKLTDEELKCVYLFNVVFFGINYKKRGISSGYNYLTVPLENGRVKIQKFIGNLYSNQNHNGNLIFNPFNKTFYIFSRWISDDDILSKIEDNDSTRLTGIADFVDHFESKYEINLRHTDTNQEKLMFEGLVFSKRMSKPQKYMFLSEMARVTPYKNTISDLFDFFKSSFVYFEILSLARQAQYQLKLPISIDLLSKCFMSKNERYPDYERYEFLGDCILKYLVTKFFVICYDRTNGILVDTKCRVIENINLTKIGKKLSLESFFSNLIFQPPTLENETCKELQEYFKFNTLGHNPSGSISQDLYADKTYADIIEAIIGACYLEKGMKVTEKLIFDFEIIEPKDYDLVAFDEFADFTEVGEQTRDSSEFQPCETNCEDSPEENSVKRQKTPANLNVLADFSSDGSFKFNEDSSTELLEEKEKSLSKVQEKSNTALSNRNANLKVEHKEMARISDLSKNDENLDGKNSKNHLPIEEFLELSGSELLQKKTNKKEPTEKKKLTAETSTIGTKKDTAFDLDRYLNKKLSFEFLSCNDFVKSISNYSGTMKKTEIKAVEQILGYKFKNKGFLEKAMLHPSSNNNIFGTRQYFEKLELIGDSVLDVLVTDEIFSQNNCPYELHETRKDLVNNQIYGNVLFSSNLYKYSQTCFEHDDLVESHQSNSYKKIYGDVFEAINGAILLDLNYDIYEYKEIWNSTIKKMLFDCYKTRIAK